MIGSDGIRGYIDLIILSLLWQHDSYGYELSDNIRKITKEEYIMKETTLYSAFTRMEKNGWILSYKGNESHGRPRTYFHITDEGKQYYLEKCAEWSQIKKIVDLFAKGEYNNVTNSSIY